MKPVTDVHVNKNTKLRDLLEQYYESGGFTAKKLGTAAAILKKMKEDKTFNFLSFPACIVSTGTRGVLHDLVKSGVFNAVITTCGTLDHDLARLWKNYYHGTFMADDAELHKKGINRLGNVFVPNESYGVVLEKKLQPIFEKIYKDYKSKGMKSISTMELIREVGRHLEKEKKKEDSIIYWAYKKNVPVFVPGITDGAFGFQLMMFIQDHKDFVVNVFKDEDELADLIFSNKKTGALMIGGGISKHHVIWWNQFKDGLDYAVYVTTAPEWDGSLSGARVREAVSWGKVKENAKYATVEGDATIILPLLAAAIL